MIRKLLFLYLFLNNSFLCFAHSPQISTAVLVQSKGNKWNLIISCSLGAYQMELKNNKPKLILENLNADEFKKMFVENLIKKINITANGDFKGVLQNPKVILGHQTDINFEVVGMPENPTKLSVEQSGFKTLNDHYCILKVKTLEKESQNFILQNDNDFSIKLDY